jgi:hypothetical protein
VRFLLGIVLLISLWPVGVAASIAANWNDEPQGHASSNSASEDSAPITAPPEAGSESPEEAITSVGRDELRPIVASVRRLNSDFQNAELAKDEPQPELASEAEGIAQELQSWRASYGARASHNEVTAVSLLTTLAQAMERLASSPTEVTFNAYNEAIDDFNQFVESAPSG